MEMGKGRGDFLILEEEDTWISFFIVILHLEVSSVFSCLSSQCLPRDFWGGECKH